MKAIIMEKNIASREEWLDARLALLEKEKELTRQKDAISAARRQMPMVKIDKDYLFETNSGKKSLGELFGDKNQLMIYHFMLGDDWEEGCKSCSFWADNFNGIDTHLAARDIEFIAMSRANISKINAFKQRMGWTFEWISSSPSDFNKDFDVSFDPEDFADGTATYNYRPFTYEMSEHAGVSVFFKDNSDTIYHTYSTYSRGLDILNGAYNYIDLAPKGRDEADLEYGMAWLRHHDRYED